jgi:hypothetical protein
VLHECYHHPPTSSRCHPLGHYDLPSERRVLLGRRIEGDVYVYDYPVRGNGRRYFVERGFESKAELTVLIADYKRQAERLSCYPMTGETVSGALGLEVPEAR